MTAILSLVSGYFKRFWGLGVTVVSALFLIFSIHAISNCHNDFVIHKETKAFTDLNKKSAVREATVDSLVKSKVQRDKSSKALGASLKPLKAKAVLAHASIQKVAVALPKAIMDTVRYDDSVAMVYEDSQEAQIDTLKRDTFDLAAALRINMKDDAAWKKADSSDHFKLIPAQELAHKRLWGEIVLGIIATGLATILVVHH